MYLFWWFDLDFGDLDRHLNRELIIRARPLILSIWNWSPKEDNYSRMIALFLVCAYALPQGRISIAEKGTAEAAWDDRRVNWPRCAFSLWLPKNASMLPMDKFWAFWKKMHWPFKHWHRDSSSMWIHFSRPFNNLSHSVTHGIMVLCKK